MGAARADQRFVEDIVVKKKIKRLLVAAGLGGVVYWFTRQRGQNDEFTFTEIPPDPPTGDDSPRGE